MMKYLARYTINEEVGGAYQFIANLKSAADLHDHDFYEFFLITMGSVKHDVNGEAQILREGSLVFIRPSDCHTYDKSAETDCQFINIVFSEATFEKILEFFDHDFLMDELLNTPLPPVRSLLAGERIVLQEKLNELKMIRLSDTKLLKIKLRSILIEIFTKYFSGAHFENTPSNTPPWLEKLYAEMQQPDWFHEGLAGMEKLSDKSREHICRSFVKYFNITPSTYINQLRLNYAANLLCNSDLDIMTICFDCGFQNLSHFYHLFQKKYHISPAKFRGKNRRIF